MTFFLVIAANELVGAFEFLRGDPYPYTFGPLIDGICSIVIGCVLALIAIALLLRRSPKILITFDALLLIIDDHHRLEHAEHSGHRKMISISA